MRLVFAGTPEPAVPALRALLASDHEVAAVLTRPDARKGRGQNLAESPVKQVAVEHGIPVLQPRRPVEVLDELKALAPDCCPVVAYGALLPRPVLDVPAHGWVNLHFSLLPAWRGAAPVQHAVLAGDELTGATTFLLEEGMDTGPVLGMLTERVRPTDTTGELLLRLAHAGAGLLLATLDGLETLVAVAQAPEGVSLAPKISVEDARVDWAAPALRVDRVIRACTPAPGAWTTLRDRRVKLGPVTVTDARLAPGELSGDQVGTATTGVRLGWVQPEGKGQLGAADWLRGLRPEPGERFT